MVDADTRTIVAGAGHIETLLAPDWLGRTVDDLFSTKIADALGAVAASVVVALGRVQGVAGSFEVVAHRIDNLLLLELEPAPLDAPSAVEVFSELELATNAFERATDLVDLCDSAARIFRRVTGFDRIMVYRFLDDEAGVVISEDRDPALGSFLNHHFPASDIPKQARALFVRNRVRQSPPRQYL